MKKIFLLLTLITFFLIPFAQTDFKPVSATDLITIKNAIKEKNGQIKTMISPFVQTKKMEMLKEDMVLKGIMYFKKTNKFRWEYTEDNPFVFVQNGEKYYSQTNGKVVEIKDNSARMFQEMSTMVSASMNGEILDDTKRFKTDFLENNKMVLVSLTPTQKGMQNYMSKIVLYFSKSTYLVSKIEISERGNDFTLIQFENVKVNQTVSDNLFELK
jgi:outer membrane lipoprotein carrier protein